MLYDPIKVGAARNQDAKQAHSASMPAIGSFLVRRRRAASNFDPSYGSSGNRSFSTTQLTLQLFQTIQRLPPELECAECIDPPRGRVLYDEKRDRFLCYGSRHFVASAKERQLVLDAFRLPHEKTEFIPGLHYEDPSSGIFL